MITLTNNSHMLRKVWPLCVMVSACASSATAPLYLEEVTVVDYYNEQELPAPGIAGISELVGRSAAEGMQAANPGQTETERPHRLMLRIQFSTDADLLTLAKRGDVVFMHGYMCNRQAHRVVLAFPTVFTEHVALRGPDLKSKVGIEQDPKRIHYYSYLNVSGNPHNDAIPREYAFDLRKSSEDVCLYVTAKGGGIGLSFKSEVTKVAAERIVSAFRGTQLGDPM